MEILRCLAQPTVLVLDNEHHVLRVLPWGESCFGTKAGHIKGDYCGFISDDSTFVHVQLMLYEHNNVCSVTVQLSVIIMEETGIQLFP